MNEREREIRALRCEVDDVAGRVARLSERVARLEAEPAEPPQAPAPRAPREEPTPAAPPPKPAPRPPRPKRSIQWEKFVGTYLIPRIGVLVIAVGVAIGLSQIVPQLSPAGRLAVAYLIGAVLIGSGQWLERRFPRFGPVLLGGGFATLYVTTYSANYVEYVKILDGTPAAMVSLGAIVAAWAVVAQLRRSRTMAAIATGLAHLTVFSSQPAPMSVVAILLLCAGSAFLILRNRWYYVGALGIGGAFLNHLAWMFLNDGAATVTNLTISLGFATGYFLLFAITELLAPEGLRRQETPLWFRSAYVSANTGAFLALGVLSCLAFDFARDDVDRFLFGAAALLLGLGFAYVWRRGRDPLANVYLAKGVGVATLGLALHFDAQSLTVSLAVETLVLLAAARWSGLTIKRLLALATAVLCVMHGVLSTHTTGMPIPYGAEGYLATALRWALAVAALAAAAHLYQITSWPRLSAAAAARWKRTFRELYLLDLEDPPASLSRVRLLWPAVLASGALLLALRGVLELAPAGDRALWAALLAAGFTALAPPVRSAVFAGAGIAGSLAAGLFLTMAVAAGDAAFGASLAASAVVLAVGLVSEPRDILAAEAWAPLRHPAIAAGVYLISAWMIGWTVIETLDATLAGTVLIGLAALAGLLVVRLRPLSMSLAHLLLLLFALLFWTAHDGELGAVARHALAWAAIALPFALAPLMRAGSGVVRLVPRAGTTAAWLLALTAYPNDVIAAGWLPAYWTALAMALVAYRRVARAPHAGWLAAFSIGLATAAGCALPLIDPASSLAIVLGTALPAACWITAERLADRQQRPSPRPATAVLRAVAPWLATLLLTVLPLCFDTIVEDYLPVAWGLVGFALFAVALATARRTYRYAGLTVLALALAKLAGVVVMADIDVILKVFAAIGLGLVLLIVGYIYFRAVFRGSSHTPSDSRHEE